MVTGNSPKEAGVSRIDVRKKILSRKKQPKYRNKRVCVDGVWFDSKGEYRRWCDLQLLEKAGEIVQLNRQVRIPLSVSLFPGVEHRVGYYVADFTYYTPGGAYVIEDFKGVKTDLYKWKKKHVKAQYGIDILETGSK